MTLKRIPYSIALSMFALQMVFPGSVVAVILCSPSYTAKCHEPLVPPFGWEETSNAQGSLGPPASDGMAVYAVDEPSLGLRIFDTPSSYLPGLGPKVAFRLYYRQRGEIPEEASYFSVGTNWCCSFRSYALDFGGSPAWIRVQRGGAGWIDYTNGVPDAIEGSIMNVITPGSTYEVDYRDGSKDVFQTVFSGSSQTFYFLTQQIDPHGSALTFNYSTIGGVFQLSTITDADAKTTSMYYENVAFPNRITKVVDPFSRTNLLIYDDLGYLTNSTDVVGLKSGFQYDSGTHRGWITNMMTPYGTTSFGFGGTDTDNDWYITSGLLVNRYVLVTLPNGANDLYLFRLDCSDFLSQTNSPLPATSPLTNTLDNVDQNMRNSFHWGPLQYTTLSTNAVDYLTATDYSLGGQQHWLLDASLGSPVCVLSSTRLPNPYTNVAGLITWFDYPGKPSGSNNYSGSSGIPIMAAFVRPDGTTSFQAYSRNRYGIITNAISTYSLNGAIALRTNKLVYGANDIDLVLRIGSNGEQVISNYFSNIYHQPDSSYDAINQMTSFLYNANRQLLRSISPAGLTTTNTYFSSGTDVNRLQQTVDIEIARTNAYTYSSGLVATHRDERGLLSTNYWDALKRLTGTSSSRGTTSNIFYRLGGTAFPNGTGGTNILDRTGTKDRLDHWTYTAYNSLRQKLVETNRNQVVTGYGYATCGALLERTNAWNTSVQQITTFDYDNQGNVIFAGGPDSYTLTYTFNSLRQLITISDGIVSNAFSYNNQGTRIAVSNSFGAENITVFDIEDRPVLNTDANAVTVTNTYDLIGRLVSRADPGGVENFGYSAQGLSAYTNQIGATNFYVHDQAMRRTFMTNANHGLITYTYDAAGDILSVTDPKGQVTIWHWDEFGHVTNKLDQSSIEILRYTYDAEDRLLSRWSKEKGTTYYTNDPVGNLTDVTYPVSHGLAFRFDSLNRMTNMVDGVGTTVYTYTLGDQLLTEDGPFASDTVTNTYANRMRNALALQQPTGFWTNGFLFDQIRRLTNVSMSAGTFTYSYPAGLPSSLPVKILLPNTSYITNTYDNVARLLSTTLRNNSGTALDSYIYAYNPANLRTNVTRSDSSTVASTYDKIGQLVAADSSVNTEDRGYFYDTAWNLGRRTNNGVTSTFTVDSKNQLTIEIGTNCTYDANGNLVQKGDLRYDYDDENQLISVTNILAGHGGGFAPIQTGGWKVGFQYDGRGRMRWRRDYYWADSGWFQTNATSYVYDGKRVIQERSSANVPTVSYTRGSDLSRTLENAGGVGGLLARSHGYSSGNWTNHNFYFADGSGNVTYMVDSSQAMVASYRYDPFGSLISQSGALANANSYRFSSKERHLKENLELYYYLYRFYDSNLQRWINRDPLFEAGGINLYTFVNNDPINLIDPAGQNWSSIWANIRHFFHSIYDYLTNDPPLIIYPDPHDRSIHVSGHYGDFDFSGSYTQNPDTGATDPINAGPEHGSKVEFKITIHF